jgi:hypothetical protein
MVCAKQALDVLLLFFALQVEGGVFPSVGEIKECSIQDREACEIGVVQECKKRVSTLSTCFYHHIVFFFSSKKETIEYEYVDVDRIGKLDRSSEIRTSAEV